jgi:hypothetical protein
MRERFLCSFALLLLGLPFFFSHSYSQVICKQGKRHQVCGGPCGVLVTREIKEEGSLSLCDCLRERERVEIDLVFVTSSTGTRFFGTEPR